MKHATQLIDQVVAESLRVKSQFFQEHKDRIVQVAENIAHGLRNGNKVLFFGNGGSAADAQHLAAEFVGRFGPDRSPLADMPWGAYWGVTLDRYGIRWMVSHTPWTAG